MGWGGGEGLKGKILEAKLEAKLEYCGGGWKTNNLNFCGRRMDIFSNCTFFIIFFLPWVQVTVPVKDLSTL